MHVRSPHLFYAITALVSTGFATTTNVHAENVTIDRTASKTLSIEDIYPAGVNGEGKMYYGNFELDPFMLNGVGDKITVTLRFSNNGRMRVTAGPDGVENFQNFQFQILKDGFTPGVISTETTISWEFLDVEGDLKIPAGTAYRQLASGAGIAGGMNAPGVLTDTSFSFAGIRASLEITTVNYGLPREFVQGRLVVQTQGPIEFFEPTVLACDGFGPPLDNGPVTAKKNRVFPFKAFLHDSNAQLIDDSGVIAPPVIQVSFSNGVQSAVDVTDEALNAGAGTDGNQFEFIDGTWRFNLKARNYSALGTYTVTMLSGDTSEYVLDSPCAGQFVIN